MPELTPEYRAWLRQNADRYGDPVVIQLLDALEAAEKRADEENLNASAALANVARLDAALAVERQRVDSAESEVRRLNAVITDGAQA